MAFFFMVLLCALGAEDAPDGARRTYTNPVIDLMGPADPHVIRHDGMYYLYPTWDGKGYNVFTSPDLVNWTRKEKCFTAPQGGAWAPDVFHNARGDGKFYLYYTVDGPGKSKQIGVAVADGPLGPFVDGGVLFTKAIDAHMFQDDDGALYLYYVEINSPGNRIHVQPMADPTRKKDTPPVLVIEPTEPWERAQGWITEGPWMLKRNGLCHLMYSGSGADGPDYAIGYATAASPLGPFKKHPGNPIAKRGGGVFGPGHHCVVEGPNGGLWMVYHQKADAGINWRRFLAVDPLWFDADGVIRAKTTRGTPQPAP